MASTDTTTKALQTFSVLAVALAAGTNLSSSLISVPAILHTASPATLAQQWKILYDRGLPPVVSLIVTSTAGFFALAYRANTLTPTFSPTGEVVHTRRNLYIGAALFAFSLVPYTRLYMLPTNNELTRRAEAGDIAEEGEKGEKTHALVRRWANQVIGRGSLLLVGAGLGLWASVN